MDRMEALKIETIFPSPEQQMFKKPFSGPIFLEL